MLGLTFNTLVVTTPVVSAQSADQGTTEPKQIYAIPAGPLEQALTRFASTAGVELSVDSALIQGKTSQGLAGHFTVQEGFAQLLREQGLQVMRNAGGVYSLRAVSASSAESGSTTTLPVMVVAATAEGAPPLKAPAPTRPANPPTARDKRLKNYRKPLR